MIKVLRRQQIALEKTFGFFIEYPKCEVMAFVADVSTYLVSLQGVFFGTNILAKKKTKG